MTQRDINFVITRESVTLIVDGESFAIQKSESNFERARELVLADQCEEAIKLVNNKLLVSTWLAGTDFTLRDNVAYMGQEPLPPALTSRIIRMAQSCVNPIVWFRFWQRLQENPSKHSVDQLYHFMAHADIPIRSDGYILAYKAVRPDYKDWHTGKCDNSIGNVLTMPRNKVVDDPAAACSYGYHVGSWSYVQSFHGGTSIILACSVDPADVVSVPDDCKQTKMRVCRYKVEFELKNKELLPEVYYPDPIVTPAVPPVLEEDYEEEDYEKEEYDAEDKEECEKEEVVTPAPVEEAAPAPAAAPEPPAYDKDARTAELHQYNYKTIRQMVRALGWRNPNGIQGGKSYLIGLIVDTETGILKPT